MRATLTFPPRRTAPVAITNVAVVPMDRPEVIPGRTVLIEDGRITAVGPADEVPIDGHDVVDGAGRYLMPGLADMHVHMQTVSEASMFLANGVTLVRNMWGTPWHLAYRARVDDGHLPGPRMVTTSPIVDGVGPNGQPVWAGSIGLDDAGVAGRLVDGFAERGYQQVKAYSLLSPAALRALGAGARATGLRLTGHCPDSVTFEQAMDAGQTCFEHLIAIGNGHLRGDGERAGRGVQSARILAERLDLDAIRVLAQRMAAEDVWNCVTRVVMRRIYRPIEENESDPLRRYVDADRFHSWNPRNDFRFRDLAPQWDEVVDAGDRAFAVMQEVVTILHQEGARLLLGTDTPNPFVFQGFAIHEELDHLTAAGLSPYAALRAGTADAARFLGESSEWGTVAAGKRADLLLLGADPLADVRAVRRPEAVFVNGYVLTRDDLDVMLAERERYVAAEPEPPAFDDRPSAPVVRSGRLDTRVNDVLTSCHCYRHVEAPDGLRVEEIVATPAFTRRVRIELSPSATIESVHLTEEVVDVGAVELDVRRTSDGYVVIPSAGGEATLIEGGPRVPSASLAASTLPLVASAVSGTADALGVLTFLDGPVVPASVTVEPAEGGGWRIETVEPSVQRTLDVTADDGGALAAVTEQTRRGVAQVTAVVAPE